MRHTVRNDIIRPFLKSSRIDFHLVRIIDLQIIIQKIIQGDNNMKRIFMDYLERSQSHQCLLMTIIQIDRYIPVINSRHIRVKNTCS